MRTKTRLQKSFIKIDPMCLKKAKKKNIKEKGLVRMAENSILYGIAEDERDSPEIVEVLFTKLRRAFKTGLRYYLNSDYVFSFEGDILVDIMELRGTVRGEVQTIYKSNKINWHNMEDEDQEDMKRMQIRNFELEGGSFSTGGTWSFGAGNTSSFGDDPRFADY